MRGRRVGLHALGSILFFALLLSGLVAVFFADFSPETGFEQAEDTAVAAREEEVTGSRPDDRAAAEKGSPDNERAEEQGEEKAAADEGAAAEQEAAQRANAGQAHAEQGAVEQPAVERQYAAEQAVAGQYAAAQAAGEAAEELATAAQYAAEQAETAQYAAEPAAEEGQYATESASAEPVAEEGQYAAEQASSEGAADPASLFPQAMAAPSSTTFYLTIPKLGLSGVPVVDDTSEAGLSQGAGHLPGTGFPWVAGSNTYIAGHRLGYAGTPSDRVFYGLPNLMPGDEVVVTDANGESYAYRVSEILEVSPSDLSVTAPVAGRDVLTLQTCIEDFGDYWTEGPNWLARYLVRADRVA